MNYTQEDLDKVLNKFLNSDIAKMSARDLNRSLTMDYKAKVANTDYKARTAKIDYKLKTKNTNYKNISKKISKPVLQYDLQGNFIQEFKSIRDAKSFLGKSKNNGDISACLKGRQKTAFGFIWKYKFEQN
jgi:hypothetical protein